MRADIAPGAAFPDYELPDHTDTPRRLSVLQGNDPMILMLGRGIYCPKDRQQLRELVAFQDQIAVGFSRLVTITTDNFVLINDLRLGVGAHWPFLHDENRLVQQDLDIAEYTDPYNNPMIPHTLVLEPGLKIYKIYNGYWYWGRPSTAELPPGPARGHAQGPLRLRSRRSQGPGGLGARGEGQVLPLWQVLSPGLCAHGRGGRPVRVRASPEAAERMLARLIHAERTDIPRIARGGG